jgi:hypothetical protein
MPAENIYVYRVIVLPSQNGEEVVACAARLGGIVAGTFSIAHEANTMRTARFKNLDLVDICPLSPESDSLAVAALARDGSLILFRDVLADKTPITLKFQSVKGVAYRIISHRGDIYVLTSKGLYVLANLGKLFHNEELSEGLATPIMPLELTPVDMNPAWARWLLVVLVNEVRKFDMDVIHELVPQHIEHGEIQEVCPVTLPLEPEFYDSTPTTQQVAV